MKHPNPPRPYPGAPSPVAPTVTSAAALKSTDVVTPPIRAPSDLSDDILQGAEAIAVFIFGTPSARRQVYRLSTEVAVEFRLPCFKLGNNTLCARKSVILRWIEKQEAMRTSVGKEEVA